MYIPIEKVIKKKKELFSIFQTQYNPNLVHQVLNYYNYSIHKGRSVQKNRSCVKGSNRKPWKQKGTGRARSGSVKSPIWRSGGVTFGTKIKKGKIKINKRMYKLAIKSIFSELFRKKKIFFIEKIDLKTNKTKDFLNSIEFMEPKKYNILIISEEISKNLFLASRNLKKIKIIKVQNINPVNLISYQKIVIFLNSIKKIKENLHE
ncbi:50S ribosomal protein L4 [bacterium endosymbiont of Pedicinus badii]|uniref:50S ribosomal protein L4 n=1 Tax=bacterium endosymbiont of Pedicinus badii TaxID=1719126 RepID=UPI0009B94958|nr:50S ribosomal protein L4 [bacterium endosymbiont of Pedicinus badii]OQM34101.1 hypothetical protein AOQ89_02025 [bacterium endosymbiont of Pedicinus badii]